MKAARKILAIGMCGVMLGVGASVMTSSTASARTYNCDQRIDSMEKKAAQDYAKGRLSFEDYEKVQDEIAYHRTLWGC